MPYDDGAFTVFLYTKGKKEVPSVELQQFLTYFEQTTVENARGNKDLAELHEMVSRVRMDEEVELEYMKIFEREEMIREDGCMLQLLRLITKKIAKGKSLEVIAEELEENAASIAPLYNLIQENPDKSVEDLLYLPCISNYLTLDHTS